MSSEHLGSANVSSSNVLNEIQALGCLSTLKMMLAYQTYEELTRVDKLTDVTCKFSPSLDLIYFVGSKNGIPITYVPIFSSFDISPLWIESVQNAVSVSDPKSIVLIIRDADSSSVRYVLTQDLVLPSEDSNRQAKSSAGISKKRKRSCSMDWESVA